MPMKGRGVAETPREIDRWEGGVGWIAYPDETMQRASHAIADGEEVWLVDPVDASGVDEMVRELGDVVGVVVTIGRHTRDAAAIARRHGAPVFLPRGVDTDLDVPTERLEGDLGDTGYRTIPVVDFPGWTEVALYGDGTLIVGDALGTVGYFLAPGERLGVHPTLRLVPPRGPLYGLEPKRILVGHGEGVFEDAADALSDALAGARRRAPSAYVRGIRTFLPL